MTYNEMIAVLQAAKAGYKIEYRIKGGATWWHCDPLWDFDALDYRVKPEPREWTVGLSPDGEITSYRPSDDDFFQNIKVREIL